MTTRIQTEMKQRTTENCHLLELLAESNSLLGQRSLTMEALQEETLDLKEQLRVLRQEKRSIEDELHTLKSSLTGSITLPPSRKPFEELEKKRRGQILKIINEHYSTESIIFQSSNSNADFGLNVEQSSSFKSSNDLTDLQYKALRTIGAPVASLYSIEQYSNNLIAKIGGFNKFTIDDVKFAVANNMLSYFGCWFKHLLQTEWDGVVPNSIDLVLAGDGGKCLIVIF